MLSKDRESLVKKVKELELVKIKLEAENEEIAHERDNLKLQINYLKNSASSYSGQNSSQKMDILLDNKATKQKLLEVKDDYGKILKEQIHLKEKWDRERESYEASLQKQRGR